MDKFNRNPETSDSTLQDFVWMVSLPVKGTDTPMAEQPR